jgi:Na+/proline symporter
VLFPGLKDQDQAFPTLIARVVPLGLRGFFLTGILATTMSTASAYLAASSSILIQDLYQPLFKAAGHGKSLLRSSRVATIVLAALAFAIALRYANIVDVVIFSTLVAPAAIFFPLVFGLYIKRTNRRAGFLAILGAAVGGVVDEVWLFGHTPVVGAVDPLFFGPLIGLIVLVVSMFLTQVQDTPRATPHLQSDMEGSR